MTEHSTAQPNNHRHHNNNSLLPKNIHQLRYLSQVVRNPILEGSDVRGIAPVRRSVASLHQHLPKSKKKQTKNNQLRDWWKRTLPTNDNHQKQHLYKTTKKCRRNRQFRGKAFNSSNFTAQILNTPNPNGKSSDSRPSKMSLGALRLLRVLTTCKPKRHKAQQSEYHCTDSATVVQTDGLGLLIPKQPSSTPQPTYSTRAKVSQEWSPLCLPLCLLVGRYRPSLHAINQRLKNKPEINNTSRTRHQLQE